MVVIWGKVYYWQTLMWISNNLAKVLKFKFWIKNLSFPIRYLKAGCYLGRDILLANCQRSCSDTRATVFNSSTGKWTLFYFIQHGGAHNIIWTYFSLSFCHNPLFKINFGSGYFSTKLFVKHNISLISKLARLLQCTFELIWTTNFVGLNLSSGLVFNAVLARTNFCQQCFLL